MMSLKLFKLSGLMLCFTLVLTLCGCATNNATTLTLINASKKTEPLLPSAAIVDSELKGRSLEVGRIYFDIVNDDPKQRLDISSKDIESLFDRPLRQGFAAAKLVSGKEPAYTVNVAIVDVKLKRGIILFPCVFRVRMEIARPDQTKVMSAELEARYIYIILVPGGALPGWTSPLTALSEMLPATAVVMTKTALGLQEGKALDSIEIYPEYISAGGVIYPPYLFLKGHPFGIYPLSNEELANVANQLNK